MLKTPRLDAQSRLGMDQDVKPNLGQGRDVKPYIGLGRYVKPRNGLERDVKPNTGRPMLTAMGQLSVRLFCSVSHHTW
jgi:hypothetical protein